MMKMLLFLLRTLNTPRTIQRRLRQSLMKMVFLRRSRKPNLLISENPKYSTPTCMAMNRLPNTTRPTRTRPTWASLRLRRRRAQRRSSRLNQRRRPKPSCGSIVHLLPLPPPTRVSRRSSGCSAKYGYAVPVPAFSVHMFCFIFDLGLVACCVQYSSCTCHPTLLAIALRGDGGAGARARGLDARRQALAAARRGLLQRAAHEQPARGAAAVRPGPRASCVALIRLLSRTYLHYDS